MNEFDLTNLDQAVADFQNTIDALRRIQTVSDHVINVAGQLDTSGAELRKDAEKMAEISEQFAEEIKQFSGEAHSLVQQMERIFQSYGETVTKEISNSVNRTNALQEENVKLEKQIQDYTISTQKSVDELRILSNNNARELREGFLIATERIKSDIDPYKHVHIFVKYRAVDF